VVHWVGLARGGEFIPSGAEETAATATQSASQSRDGAGSPPLGGRAPRPCLSAPSTLSARRSETPPSMAADPSRFDQATGRCKTPCKGTGTPWPEDSQVAEGVQLYHLGILGSTQRRPDSLTSDWYVVTWPGAGQSMDGSGAMLPASPCPEVFRRRSSIGTALVGRSSHAFHGQCSGLTMADSLVGSRSTVSGTGSATTHGAGRPE